MIVRTTVVASLALALLAGHVLDRTTGQPLAHVRVSSGASHATSDATGRFVLRGIAAGTAAVLLESDDVPAQRFTVKLGAGTVNHDFRVCSTTLDYDCGAPHAGGAG